MRALALLIVVVVAFLLVLKFYPSSELSSEVRGSEEREAPAESTPPAEATDFESQFLAEDAGGPDGPPSGESGGSGGSDRPGPAGEPDRVAATSGTLSATETASEAAPFTPRARGAGGEGAGSATDPGEVLIGAALLHGAPRDLAGALDANGVRGARRDLLLAFSHALAGDRQRAEDMVRNLSSTAVSAQERGLLDLALGESGAVPRAASIRREGPVLLAMRMSLVAQEATALLAGKAHASAARDFSELLLLEVDAPWASDRASLAVWGQGLAEAQEGHRWNPRGEWPSVEVEVQPGDHLTAIRKRYLAQYPERRICTGLIERANRIRGYLQPGQTLRIPTEPVSVLVDIDTRRVLYLHGGEVAATWEVGVGRAGEDTILGDFTAGEKNTNPTWFQVGQDPIPFGDPRNPLGTRWIGWNQDGRSTHYGFHGTKEPDSIGHAASDGCVRFHNRDVEEIFQVLPVGTPIHVQP
jgi:lipoprotein-anchoring transpeptidase ErfK/SrfK